MDAPKVTSPKFRPRDLVRARPQGAASTAAAFVTGNSEHRINGAETSATGERWLSLDGISGQFRAEYFTLVQMGSAIRGRSHHHEDEVIGGAHFPCGKADWAIQMANDPVLAERGEKDMVNLPDHYARFTIEPIYFVVENARAFKDAETVALMSHIVPYLMRHEFKGGNEDLRKAKRLIDMLIAKHDGDPDWWKVDR